MSVKRIEPRVLKGFRDYLPRDASRRRGLFNKLSNIFELHGFNPIETPALEYSEILLGKGSDETDKQMFRFKDQGERDVSLRFDLTVPLARFVAEHQNDLIFPFKRYHIGTVWRAEKPQKGRYREFTQCDFDIIGSTSSLSDSEILQIVASFFSSIGVNFKIRINHRGLLSCILQSFDIEEKKTEALRAIDKLDKIGIDGVINELKKEAEISQENAAALLKLLDEISVTADDHIKCFKTIRDKLGDKELLNTSLNNLETVFSSLMNSGYPKDIFKLDISIARGLDYYTGIVFETQLLDVNGLGSVCSGGRYDDLASLYTSRKLPGVGGSVGIDRLLVGLEELNYFKSSNERTGVLVSILDSNEEAFKILNTLRKAGIQAEIFPDTGKLGLQFKYADKKNLRYVLIRGEEERSKNSYLLKDLSIEENNQRLLHEDEIVTHLKSND